MSQPHRSVLLNAFLTFFQERHVKVFLDGTLGAGGFAEGMLMQHPEIECLIGIDQDPTALEIAEKRLLPWKNKIHFIHGNFEHLEAYMKQIGVKSVDGMVFDLGVSSMQLDRPEKGFSFMRDGPLDMRMDPTASITAAEIVNTWSEEDLGRVFKLYGEEKRWRFAARCIVNARHEKPLNTTMDLNQALGPLYNRKPGIHPFTLIYQALRICVNRELDVVEKTIPRAIECLAKGGRLGLISFHSLEDRIVKHLFRFAASDKYDTSGIGGVFLDKEPTVRLLTRKPVVPTEEEIAENPRCRSAKLRVVEKL